MSESTYTGWLWHPDHGAKGFKNITMDEKSDRIREGWVDYHDRPKGVPIPVIDWSVEESSPEQDESNLPVAELLPIPEEEPEPKRRGPGRPPKVKV